MFWLIGIFLAAITLPYLWPALITPEGMRWGGLLWKADDQNVHLAWAKQAELGHFFVRDLFTTEGLTNGESPRFFNMLPYCMGLFSRLTGSGVLFWYHALRVVGAAWAVWQFYGLARVTLPAGSPRVFAVAMLTLTTGTGFLLTLAPGLLNRVFLVDSPDPGNFPSMPEAFFFTSAFAYPLNVISYGLLAYLARFLLSTAGDPEARPQLGSYFLAFFAALALSNIHTYDALPLILLAAVWGALRFKAGDKIAFTTCVTVIIGCLLPLAYQVLVFRGSEEFRVKALTPTLPPAPLHLALTFAPLLVLAAFGVRRAAQLRHRWFAIAWVLTIAILIYVPGISFARKMIEGVQMPLILLAAAGLTSLLHGRTETSTSGPAGEPGKMVSRSAWGWAFVALMALSPAQFAVWCLGNATENNASRLQVLMPPLSLATSEWAALEFINERSERPASVAGATLCLPFVGSYGPRTSGTTYYLAHWAETLHFQQKLNAVSRFYSGRMARDEAAAFLKAGSIQFILQSQYERAYFHQTDLGAIYGLRPLWQGGTGDTRTLVWAPPG